MFNKPIYIGNDSPKKDIPYHGYTNKRFGDTVNHPRRNKIRDWPRHLKEFRRGHSLTQRNLADILQTSLRSVENWETSVHYPPAFLKLALERVEQVLDKKKNST